MKLVHQILYLTLCVYFLFVPYLWRCDTVGTFRSCFVSGNVLSEGKAECGPPLNQTLKEDMAPPEAS